MSKKGFSLIELLAVIVILGIIAVIGVVSYSKYLATSKKTAFDNMGKTLYESTKTYFVSNSSKIPSSQGASIIIDAQTLIDGGYTEKLSDPRSNKSTDTCNQSTIKVTRNDAGTNFNMDLTYLITIVCNGNKIETYSYPKQASE